MLLAVRSEEDGAGLADLQDWLRHEPELRGRVTPVTRAPGPDELGAVTDVLSVAVGGGGVLAVLAASLRSFFAQPRRSDIRITVHAADGSTVEVDAHRVTDVETLLRATLGRAE
ncbi:hypothetical protein R8Z50_15980 [Longispora sp. K20-0274]|uniref:effector-associated constant component EACC1 n=1 Tax=Longispora sp. K20-0274 TaxID=3088255 RepID=UPI00399B40A8